MTEWAAPEMTKVLLSAAEAALSTPTPGITSASGKREIMDCTGEKMARSPGTKNTASCPFASTESIFSRQLLKMEIERVVIFLAFKQRGIRVLEMSRREHERGIF